jgi:ubiquinone/menaquinone biosynthesis C-methylase UbiE
VPSGSFWSRFASIDTEARPEALLRFLDEYAALEPVQEHKRRATDALMLAPGDEVLDVGCGTGVDLAGMLERVRPGGRVCGVDASALAVAQANRRLAGAPGATVLVADAQDLPFEDGAFDACRADRTLQHLQRPDQALHELQRVLRPGGRLVVLEVATEIKGSGAVDGHPVARVLRERSASADESRNWLPLMLPLLLARAGFRDVRLDVAVTRARDVHAVEVIIHARDSAADAIAAGVLTAAELDDWAATLRAAAAAGELSAELRGLCIVAETAPAGLS